jgi:two-component sensor histidine kinase
VATPISLYEKNYFDVFGRLVAMIKVGEFPFAQEEVGTEETPRVGDGFVLVDGEGRIEFASPNASNAFHRMGVYSTLEGHTFTELGVEASAVQWALATCHPVVEEVERRPDVIVLVQCIPLLEHHVANGAVILMRDVTDVRRLDRLLLSKDAAIREVHHRVKNNLQTISSLLSLQARRITSADGRAALNEAERRVRSIALVHEILSRDPGDQVPFDEIVVSLVRMAEDSVVSAKPVEITVHGDLGEVTADVATPLAVTLAELLQNAVEHAFSGTGGDRGGSGGGERPVGHVEVTLAHEPHGLEVTVSDDGKGIEPGFDIERTTSLGLSIVRDLIVSQLGGSITMGATPGGGTLVEIRLPPVR